MNSLRSMTMSSSSCFKKSREFPVGTRGVVFLFQAEQEVNSAFLFLRLEELLALAKKHLLWSEEQLLETPPALLEAPLSVRVSQFRKKAKKNKCC